MGSRVDASSNKVEGDFVLCANCGRPDDVHPDGFNGHAPLEYAEENWVDVNRELACSIYCAAKLSGMSEEEAQLARAMKTRMDMRAEGMDDLADADEAYIQDIQDNPENHPFIPGLDAVADEDTHEHDQSAESMDTGDIDAEWAEVRRQMGRGE
jgi:hypothetical protein